MRRRDGNRAKPPEAGGPDRREAPTPTVRSPRSSAFAAVDPDAFDRFYDKYHDRIFAFAYWRTGDEDAATDVTAETFLTAWEKRGRFRWQGYTFGAWLFQIARGVISHR